MRKLLSLLFIAFSLSLSVLAKTVHIPDYFPVAVKAEWHWEDSLKNKSTNVITAIDKDGVITMTTTSMGAQTTESQTYYKKADGFVYLLKSETPAYNFTADYEPDRKELMNPLAIGKSWDWTGDAGGVTTSQTWKAVGTEKVTVPAGTFNAVKVESDAEIAGTKAHYTYWYVDGVGAVKVLTESGGASTTTVLTRYSFPKR